MRKGSMIIISFELSVSSVRGWIVSRQSWIVSGQSWIVSGQWWMVSGEWSVVSEIFWIVICEFWVYSFKCWIVRRQSWVVSLPPLGGQGGKLSIGQFKFKCTSMPVWKVLTYLITWHDLDHLQNGLYCRVLHCKGLHTLCGSATRHWETCKSKK